ncbi:MAG: ABC transporter ATP-binding protein [Lachnospiraceae bacterium]|nr:ABC transporter ATP-binding protein [Lachnospiraceae bacterium]
MIELNRISFAYPGCSPLLKEVSVSFPRGKITTILGPNGCGKSTLLKVACNLMPATEGEVLLEGKRIREMKPKKVARQVALLSQSHQPPEIEVADLVSYGRFPYRKYGQGITKEDKRHVEEAMERVNMADYRHRLVNKLSGGERQRAYIAMALAQDTELIFLDEPTTYLDIHIRFELMELVRELNRSGKTIVMVLHDLNLALEYSHNLILMEAGKIVTTGSPEEIITSGEMDRVFQIRTKIFEEQENTYYYFAQKEE